ncbi:MAG: class I SAM-dependent methyltransferase [Promethearchaeota archaeon]
MSKKKKIFPTAEDVYDRYAQDYNGEFAPTTYQTSRSALSFANDLTWHYLQKYLPQDFHATLADIGGGDGYWSEKLIQAGYSDIVITDISANMLDEARKRFHSINQSVDASEKHDTRCSIKYEKADILDIAQFSDSSFDFVFSLFDPVSYSLNPAKALQELARIAKPDTFVFVTLDTKFRRVPELISANQIPAAEELLENNLTYDFGHPQYNLTWEELAQNFTDAGLDVVKIVGIPVFMHQVDVDVLNSMEKDPAIRSRLLSMELAHGTNRSLINFAGHLLMVGQKKKRADNKKN